MSYKFFYKPKDSVCADFIPYCENGVFHLFYLKDWRNVDKYGEGTPWYHITTEDFFEFKEIGESIPRGASDGNDLYVFTGSVIKAMGKYHIFYTGHNPHFEKQNKPVECIMHAVSDDLNTWEKQPHDTFYPNRDKYDINHFRDPFVFYDEKNDLYKMFLVARYKNGKYNEGFTALYTSRDLMHWDDGGEFWAPNMYHTHECPDLFKLGDKWYLIFSEYSDVNLTHYAMSDSPEGPWEIKENYVIDTTMYYAAKSAEKDGKRYLFGWIGTRHDNMDENYRDWGGNLAVHEIVQNIDGTLGCKLPECLNRVWHKIKSVDDIKLFSKGKRENALLFNSCGDTWRLDTEITLSGDIDSFGVCFGQDYITGHGYKFEFLYNSQSARLASNTTPIQNYQSSRIFPIKPGDKIRITIIKEKDISVLYANNVPLSTRVCSSKGEDISVYSTGGIVQFKNTMLFRL